MHNTKIFAIVLALAGLAGCADVDAPDQARMTDGTLVASAAATPMMDGKPGNPPPGFVSFCMHNVSVCASHAGAGNQVVLNETTRAQLIAVNNRINHAITYKSDQEQYGIANVWTLNAVGGYGNCKDYALAKQQALIAEGFPESALRIAIVKTRLDELHAVLTVDTDKGDYVLDSIDPQIEPWAYAQYRWLSRQSADNPLRWVRLTEN